MFSTILGFLNDQLLKMNWLYDLVKLLVERVFGISISTKLGGSIHFFFFDTIKIFIMLSVIIFIVSIIRSFFPPERTKKLLGEGKARGFLGNVFAALLGIVTPFCSCSAVPVFIGGSSLFHVGNGSLG